jgi:hypothetical protein
MPTGRRTRLIQMRCDRQAPLRRVDGRPERSATRVYRTLKAIAPTLQPIGFRTGQVRPGKPLAPRLLIGTSAVGCVQRPQVDSQAVREAMPRKSASRKALGAIGGAITGRIRATLGHLPAIDPHDTRRQCVPNGLDGPGTIGTQSRVASRPPTMGGNLALGSIPERPCSCSGVGDLRCLRSFWILLSSPSQSGEQSTVTRPDLSV